MKVDPGVVQSSEKRAPAITSLSRAAAPKLMRPADAGARAAAAPMPSKRRIASLGEGGATPSATELERLIGTSDLLDEFYLDRALAVAKAVCRVTLRRPSGAEAGWATGFMVSPRVMLTNWHVFKSPRDAAGAVAEFDFRLDIRGEPVQSARFAVRADAFYFASEALDFALVAVDERSMSGGATGGGRALEEFGYLRLVPQAGKIDEGEWVTIIQHPGGRRRQISVRENELISKQDDFLWYKSDTAQGSSGSPAFNDSLQVVALHHAGKARRDGAMYVLKDGTRVASLEGVDDSEVDWEANEGVRVSRICAAVAERAPGTDEFVAELRHAMEHGGDVLERAMKAAAGRENDQHGSGAGGGGASGAGGSGGGGGPVTIHIANLHAQTVIVGGGAGGAIRGLGGRDALGADAGSAGGTGGGGLGLEAFKRPRFDPDYSNRTGYDANFLGIEAPMPTVTDLSVTSRLQSGEHVIPYEHFSLVLHKERRLAIFTASNVDFRPASRKPPDAGDLTRRGLSGLGPNDREQWITDARLPGQHQLPDIFFNKDRTAFDKGHVVRRDDVCFGTSRAQIVRANGDTYHSTNCSPQTEGFNQSTDGQDNWGDYENFIGSAGKTEPLCVFAGPVLQVNDRQFEGVDELGEVRIKIPRAYWKVVVAREGDALKAWALVLKQNLTGVPFEEEFALNKIWKKFDVRIAALEERIKLVRFADVVKNADQFGLG